MRCTRAGPQLTLLLNLLFACVRARGNIVAVVCENNKKCERSRSHSMVNSVSAERSSSSTYSAGLREPLLVRRVDRPHTHTRARRVYRGDLSQSLANQRRRAYTNAQLVMVLCPSMKLYFKLKTTHDLDSFSIFTNFIEHTRAQRFLEAGRLVTVRSCNMPPCAHGNWPEILR